MSKRHPLPSAKVQAKIRSQGKPKSDGNASIRAQIDNTRGVAEAAEGYPSRKAENSRT